MWQVPESAPVSQHKFKYRLAYVRDGVRVVGYDNERGKGDHKHILEKEMKYTFSGIDELLADFWNDVEKAQ